MVNNKQVNVWRGDAVPPTIYHVWIQNNTRMLLYNGTEWVVFIDDYATLTKIDELIDQVTEVESQITSLQGNTVNSIPITQNPVLTGDNLKTEQTGTFIQSSDNLSDALIKLDLLLTTQIIQ